MDLCRRQDDSVIIAPYMSYRKLRFVMTESLRDARHTDLPASEQYQLDMVMASIR